MMLEVKRLGLLDYEPVYAAMQQFTEQRQASTPDEIWVLQHLPVFTQGLAGKPEHILEKSNIPVIQTDRGGQVTYHGPGQIILYCLLDVARYQLQVTDLVHLLEAVVIELLAEMSIVAQANQAAPGVYITNAKIASIGLRLRKGFSYHGLSFNLDMDLSPFQLINPCGMAGLAVTQLADFVEKPNFEQIEARLVSLLAAKLQARAGNSSAIC